MVVPGGSVKMLPCKACRYNSENKFESPADFSGCGGVSGSVMDSVIVPSDELGKICGLRGRIERYRPSEDGVSGEIRGSASEATRSSRARGLRGCVVRYRLMKDGVSGEVRGSASEANRSASSRCAVDVDMSSSAKSLGKVGKGGEVTDAMDAAGTAGVGSGELLSPFCDEERALR